MDEIIGQYIINSVDAICESKADPVRFHMGPSELGHSCDRRIWLSFRKVVIERKPGRVRRLLDRGKREEREVISHLRSIGMTINTNIKPFTITGHLKGEIDGLIEFGVPGFDKMHHILEIKTSSDKNFKHLEKHGVRDSKLAHFAQMQMYMYALKKPAALYVAVNKDNDAWHIERVEYDENVAQMYVDRGVRLSMTEHMPPPLSHLPSWYECKMCPAYDFCHVTKTTKEANCRTCAMVTPKNDGTFYCEKWNGTIPTEHQMNGCDAHVVHPELVPWKLIPSNDPDVATYCDENGVIIKNGQPSKDVYSSKELLANPLACFSQDQLIQELRSEFGARIK